MRAGNFFRLLLQSIDIRRLAGIPGWPASFFQELAAGHLFRLGQSCRASTSGGWPAYPASLLRAGCLFDRAQPSRARAAPIRWRATSCRVMVVVPTVAGGRGHQPSSLRQRSDGQFPAKSAGLRPAKSAGLLPACCRVIVVIVDALVPFAGGSGNSDGGAVRLHGFVIGVVDALIPFAGGSGHSGAGLYDCTDS